MSVFMHKIRRFSMAKIHWRSRRKISGVLCDIDGVLLRGRSVLAGATESIKVLYEHRIPVLFLTNQVLQSEEEKALNLSQTLHIKCDRRYMHPIFRRNPQCNVGVKPEQVVLAHSPLRHCSILHDKFVLVLGQQNIKKTAFSVGFQNICQIEDVQAAYPLLDMIDKKRRCSNIQNQKPIPKIEGIILLGEPIRWESQLQLVIDLLVSNGTPSIRPESFPKQHIPIVACNTDLLWMAEAPSPRFGHGTFLLCLEALYQKITGNTLQYAMITGKPFLVTFQYAERIIQNYLKNNAEMFLDRVYIIGDNPDTDIYGGNLYKQYLQTSNLDRNNSLEAVGEKYVKCSVNNVTSILVGTGVHSQENMNNSGEKPVHVHKDVCFDPDLTKPDHTVLNIEEAVQFIIRNETNVAS